MRFCVLQKNDTIRCGSFHYSIIDRIVPILTPDMSSVEDIFKKLNAQRSHWGLGTYTDDKSKKKQRITMSVDETYQKAGLPIKYLGQDDILREAPEGQLFVDLKNKAIWHLDYKSPESNDFVAHPSIYKSYGDPKATQQYNECKSKIPADMEQIAKWKMEDKCRDQAYLSKKPAPKGFVIGSIRLDWKPQGEEYLKPNEQFISSFIQDLQQCQHPSGEFYRSLTSCIKPNDKIKIYQK